MNSPLLVNIFDSNFIPFDQGSVSGKIPQLIEYIPGLMDWSGVTLVTDQWMMRSELDGLRTRYKIGWLHEGRESKPSVYAMSWRVRHRYDFILTHDAELLGADPEKYKKIIRGGCWVPQEQWGIHPKTKNVSMILSDKQQLSGHRLRHRIADRVFRVDLFGARGTKIGNNKQLAYRDYKFAIIVEACQEENFFSEHLIDCLVFGTIPIYWGCPNIGEYFDESGFLTFSTIGELRDLLHNLSDDLWEQMLPAVQRNFEKAEEYEITDDWIARNYLLPLVRAE